MEYDNLKSNWKKTGSGKKNLDQLMGMTKINNHPKVKRMRIKFLIESLLLVVFIALYYDGFDGADKPLWANLFLISTTTIYIINRFFGLLVLRNPIHQNNLKQSLIDFQRKLKSIAISIVASAFLFGCGVIVFFISSIQFTTSKYVMTFIMFLLLILLTALSSRNWIKRIQHIKSSLKAFEDPTLDS